MTVEFLGGALDGYCTLMDDGRALRTIRALVLHTADGFPA